MNATIEISLDALMDRVSAHMALSANNVADTGVSTTAGQYFSVKDQVWFLGAALDADTKIRSSLGMVLTTEVGDISDTALIYNIECRDQPHGQAMAELIEQSITRLICNQWLVATYQPLKQYDWEILNELKSTAYLTKRTRRKYSLY